MQPNNRKSRGFNPSSISLATLRERAYNYRWAEVEEGVIPLTAADPDFPVAKEITDAVRNYIKPGVFSYGPPEGLPFFREAISDWYLKTKHVTFHPSLILPVNSAAFGLFLAAMSILSKGDKAIILEPVDFLFRKAIENAGAEVITSRLDKETGEIDEAEIRSLVSPEVKAIFLCNPNNPLGKTMTTADLLTLGKIALEHNLYIVSDEIWADISFDLNFRSIASVCDFIGEKIITVSGLSKNFGLAGLRIGYVAVSDPALYKVIYLASKASSTAYGISTLSQVAGTAALNKGGKWLDDFLIHLKEMRAYVEQRIENIPSLESNHPDSTYLFFPKLRNTSLSSHEMCDYLLKKARVALVPGGKNWFEDSSEGYVRICYATSQPILREAFDKIEEALAQQHNFHAPV